MIGAKVRNAASFLDTQRPHSIGFTHCADFQVLLELYRKYGDKWIVELLLDDIIDWHDWFSTYRLLPPLNLVCLGSNSVPGDTYWSPNTLPSSRLESGLDNSPMWDDTTFNTTSHQMQVSRDFLLLLPKFQTDVHENLDSKSCTN